MQIPNDPTPQSPIKHPNKTPLSSSPKMRKWTSFEDSLLEKLQKKLGNKWLRIANLIPNRTSSQCSQRFRRKFKPKKCRKPWTCEEDSIVKELVKKNGRNWQKISGLMSFSRSAKQIRERFSNVLDKNIRKSQWTEEEDQLLMGLFRKYGKKWAKIAGFMNGRPENCIKNRFHSKLKKKLEDYDEKCEENSEGKDEKFIDNFNDKFNQKFNDKFNDKFNEKFNDKFNEKFNVKFNEKLNEKFNEKFNEKLNEKLNEEFNEKNSEKKFKRKKSEGKFKENFEDLLSLKTAKKKPAFSIKNFEKTERHPLALNLNSENTSSQRLSEEDKEGIKMNKYHEEDENFCTGFTSSRKENFDSFTINSLLPHDVLKIRMGKSQNSGSEIELKMKKSSSSDSSENFIKNKLVREDSYQSLKN